MVIEPEAAKLLELQLCRIASRRFASCRVHVRGRVAHAARARDGGFGRVARPVDAAARIDQRDVERRAGDAQREQLGVRGVELAVFEIDVAELRELLVEAWLARAPRRLAQAYLDAQP